jgi:hypothetical protein
MWQMLALFFILGVYLVLFRGDPLNTAPVIQALTQPNAKHIHDKESICGKC